MSAPAVTRTQPVDEVGSRWRDWERYFLANHEEQRRRDARIPWREPVTMDEGVRARWVRSLQKFQVGESGDGAHLVASAQRADDELYVTCARYFVAEEQSHARLLGDLLARLDAAPTTRDWTDAAFVQVRRLMGVATELAVIQVAEGVALIYYGALADGAPDEVIRAVAERIHTDEAAHVAFHVERIADDLAVWSAPRRAALRALWFGAQLGATAVVAIDHQHVLADCGRPLRQALADVTRTVTGIRQATYAEGAARRQSRQAPT